MDEKTEEMRSLALTPTWSVASVLTFFVAVSLLVERSIHWLSNWLDKTRRKPLLQTVEKMKEELMLLGFISLLLTATSSTISNFCISSKFFGGVFAPCSESDVHEADEENTSEGRKLWTSSPQSFRRAMSSLHQNKCPEGMEPFVSYEGLEQLHRFIFIMAVTHVSYSCLTMLLAIVKCEECFLGNAGYIVGETGKTKLSWTGTTYSQAKITKELVMRRQSSFVKSRASNFLTKSDFWVWVMCFFRQFGRSVIRADYLTLRKGFITEGHSFILPSPRSTETPKADKNTFEKMVYDLFSPRQNEFSQEFAYSYECQMFQLEIPNHNLTRRYDFHSYMVRSMEEEFQRIVGVSGPLWGFVVAFMLFNIKGSNLYFWIAVLPIALVLLVGTKLQHVIATLTLESAGLSGFFTGTKLKPRDDLFWFKKPELLLSLIHFILFQNSFELASFFWFWWQFGYDSCFIKNHLLVYLRLILGFSGQFLCSYSTLPLYALVTQMGTNYKAALIPNRIRETIHGWKKSAAKRKKRLGIYGDDSTIHTDTSTVMSLDEDHNHMFEIPESGPITHSEIELQSPPTADASPPVAGNENSSRVGTPLLRPFASSSSRSPSYSATEEITRCHSMPSRRE